MKNKIFLILFVVVLFLTTTVNAGVVVDETTINFVAGESFNIHYQLLNNETTTTCHVTTFLSPDDVGIVLEYQPTIVLEKGKLTYFNISVHTDMHLKPVTYLLTTHFEVEGSSPGSSSNNLMIEKKQTVYIYPYGSVEYNTGDNTPEVPFPRLIIGQEDIKPGFNYLYLILIIAISIFVIMLLFIKIKKRREKHE